MTTALVKVVNRKVPTEPDWDNLPAIRSIYTRSHKEIPHKIEVESNIGGPKRKFTVYIFKDHNAVIIWSHSKRESKVASWHEGDSAMKKIEELFPA